VCLYSWSNSIHHRLSDLTRATLTFSPPFHGEKAQTKVDKSQLDQSHRHSHLPIKHLVNRSNLKPRDYLEFFTTLIYSSIARREHPHNKQQCEIVFSSGVFFFNNIFTTSNLFNLVSSCDVMREREHSTL